MNFIDLIHRYKEFPVDHWKTHTLAQNESGDIIVENASSIKDPKQNFKIMRIFSRNLVVFIDEIRKNSELRASLVDLVVSIEKDFDLDLSFVLKGIFLGHILVSTPQGEEKIPLDLNHIKHSPVLQTLFISQHFPQETDKILDLSSFSSQEVKSYLKYREDQRFLPHNHPIEPLFSALRVADYLLDEELFKKISKQLGDRLGVLPTYRFYWDCQYIYQYPFLAPKIEDLMNQILHQKILKSRDPLGFLTTLAGYLKENCRNIDCLDLRGIAVSSEFLIELSKSFPFIESLQLSDPEVVTLFIPNHWMGHLKTLDVTGCSSLRSVHREESLQIIGKETTLLEK